MLLKNQTHVSPQRGLPVDDKGSASTVTTVTGETVQFYYSNSGTLTADAGQAAGVAVLGSLTYDNIKNSVGNIEATFRDTSLSFTSTAFTSEIYIDFELFENLDATTFANRLSAVTNGMTNGQYAVDYSTGTLYGVKATTQTTLTSATYKYRSSTMVGSDSISSIVPGTGATNLGKAEDAVAASGDTGVMVLAVRADTAASTAANGDYVPLLEDSTGHLWSAEGFAGAFENNTDGVAWVHHKVISSSTSAPSVDISAALEASTISKNTPGRLYKYNIRIDSTLANGTYYIQFMNSATLPADGAVTFLTAPIKKVHVSGTDDYITDDFSLVGGIYASAGIVMCISTTEFTKTIGTAVTSSTIIYA